MEPINMSFIRVDAANRRGFVMVRERLERVAVYDFTARNQSFLAGNRNPLQPKHVLLSDVISMNGHAEARNLVLLTELDGGCEYNVLHTVGEKTLDQFEQIAIVFHGLTEPRWENLIGFALDKLNATHQLVHVHAYNSSEFLMADGKVLPRVLECTYLRRDCGEFTRSKRFFPTSLDAPSDPHEPELNLGYWG